MDWLQFSWLALAHPGSRADADVIAKEVGKGLIIAGKDNVEDDEEEDETDSDGLMMVGDE